MLELFFGLPLMVKVILALLVFLVVFNTLKAFEIAKYK